jgi:hypothetical protein
MHKGDEMDGRPPLTRVLLGLAVLLTGACGQHQSPDSVLEPITIESVDIRILESSPPRAVAHVKGVIGDGCSELHSVTQSRDGSTVTVTILRERARDAICTQIAKLYEADIPLEGQYPPGRYLLRVNGFEKPFITE